MATTNATIIKGIDIVAYTVQDGSRAKAFYRDVLGLPMGMDYGDAGAEFTLGDGTTFGVYQMPDGTFAPSGGVMFAVDDIASAVATFKGRGVAFEDDGKIDESPVCFMAVAKDPDGNSFIVHQRK